MEPHRRCDSTRLSKIVAGGVYGEHERRWKPNRRKKSPSSTGGGDALFRGPPQEFRPDRAWANHPFNGWLSLFSLAKPGEGGGEAGETAQDNAEGIPETGIGEARNGQFSAPSRENRMLAGTAGHGGHSFPSTDFAADYNSGSKGSGSFWMIFSQRSMVSGS